MTKNEEHTFEVKIEFHGGGTSLRYTQASSASAALVKISQEIGEHAEYREAMARGPYTSTATKVS